MPTAEQLADAFCEILNEWLTPDEIRQVNEHNAAEMDKHVCHSHDFCDANEALLQAMAKFGLDFTGASDQPQMVLLNDTWNLAKSRSFKPTIAHEV